MNINRSRARSFIKNLILLCIPLIFLFICPSCTHSPTVPALHHSELKKNGISLLILGTVQDGGSPHIGCKKPCCVVLFDDPDKTRMVTSLGLVDYDHDKQYLFEASPDAPRQIKQLMDYSSDTLKKTPDGIFLTHAHIGHYTGLMYLGKEALNAHEVPIYAMPRMQQFLIQNGPWSQLVADKNIAIKEMTDTTPVILDSSLSVSPFLVPHRDEFSETVGFLINGPNKKVLFIPDIDRWEKWNNSLIHEIEKVDYAFIDGTFYDSDEINHRDVSEIPHPFVIQSMELLKNIPVEENKKIFFIHFNHTNPLLRPDSKASKWVKEEGYSIARTGTMLSL